jgi:hypothetical protein
MGRWPSWLWLCIEGAVDCGFARVGPNPTLFCFFGVYLVGDSLEITTFRFQSKFLRKRLFISRRTFGAEINVPENDVGQRTSMGRLTLSRWVSPSVIRLPGI